MKKIRKKVEKILIFDYLILIHFKNSHMNRVNFELNSLGDP